MLKKKYILPGLIIKIITMIGLESSSYAPPLMMTIHFVFHQKTLITEGYHFNKDFHNWRSLEEKYTVQTP